MTLIDRLEEHFRNRPEVWIDGRVLAEVAGFYGWRTQVSRLRQVRAMRIENRQRPIKGPDGKTAYVISEYKFTPPPAADLIEAIDRAVAAESAHVSSMESAAEVACAE